MDALKSLLHSRIRNQISNILLFGSLIGLTTTGLLAGVLLGVLLISRTGIHGGSPLFQLLIIISATTSGFAIGVFSSLYVSPLILRRAFFATPLTQWRGIAVYSARDADLPGGHPNVFVSGFSFGIGPFKPTIFVAEGAIRILSRTELLAVFAHEFSHIECGHLGKRVQVGITTFISASFLTSIMLIGAQWSGYAETSSALSVFAGVLPAALTWMAMRQLLGEQEFEADLNAIRKYGISPESLILALETLQGVIGGKPHPLVSARIDRARKMIPAEENRNAVAA